MSLRTRRQGAAIVAKEEVWWAERYFTELYFDVRTTNVYVNWFRICTQEIACHCTALL